MKEKTLTEEWLYIQMILLSYEKLLNNMIKGLLAGCKSIIFNRILTSVGLFS